uniref:D-aminoacyl-tRNA deacylase n=1 Tax=Oncorhynchus kisutch TaxID=8019 RepID=A0A8C7HFV1_ONCKI
MKAIIQRVTTASVSVGEVPISSIGRGLCVLLGISMEDTQKDVDYMVRKILNLRLFDDENGRAWSKSVMDKEYEVLCVSQFTLQCILKGNKPDFHAAMPAELSQPFYNNILEHLRSTYKPEMIKDGQFGAYMQVHIQNDGPVTIELVSPSAPMDPKQVMTHPAPPRLMMSDGEAGSYCRRWTHWTVIAAWKRTRKRKTAPNQLCTSSLQICLPTGRGQKELWPYTSCVPCICSLPWPWFVTITLSLRWRRYVR